MGFLSLFLKVDIAKFAGFVFFFQKVTYASAFLGGVSSHLMKLAIFFGVEVLTSWLCSALNYIDVWASSDCSFLVFFYPTKDILDDLCNSAIAARFSSAWEK